MRTDQQKAREIFLHAVGQLPPDQWQGYVAEACGGDTKLERQVGCLLQVHRDGGSFLESPAPGLEAILHPPGAVIGPYKLLQQLGEGGMGSVFMAEQTQPVQRRVALKVIKAGMDSRQVIARFEAERQALAMMEHVNIARVLDAATTPDGRPYFVMELVHGVSITQYCDDNQLTPRQRLELFVPVCQAIQHAHQKGIIHRDIKPSNVMVTLYDGQPVPKVIDFGVAKATEQRLTERTLFTQYGTMVGTLEYMSPEQAEMSASGVDTRSDIYSLGVLLYELLTGSTPLSRKQLKEAAYAEILRLIKEQEPPRPSTRLSDSGEALSTISSQRQTEPAKLARLLRGELDWIIMKCLEKDRGRRYETANSFAADIQRYLNDEPVQACPPSSAYRFRKFTRRNKGVLAVASAAALVVLLGTVSLAVSNFLIRQEQARTREERDRAARAHKLADTRADEIRQGFEQLKSANARLERGQWYSSQQHWDEANDAFSQAIELRPDHASAWLERGELLAQLGLFDLASEDFARAFQLREPDTTKRWYRFALLRLSLGDQDGFHQVCRRMRQRFHGTTNGHFAAELLRTSVLTADTDENSPPLVSLAEQAVSSNPGSWYCLYLLGIAHFRDGQDEQAIRRLRESLTADPDWPIRALSYPVLAMAYHRSSQVAEARQALDAATESLDGWIQDRYQAPNEQHWSVDQRATANWPIAWWDWLEFQSYYHEAKLLIDGGLPSDDPRLHVLRARAFAGLRRNFTADVEYATVLKLWPDDRLIRLEAHRSAGFSSIERRQWSRAATEFTQASELAPDDAKLWRFRAVAHLAAGNVPAFRQICVEMLERFGNTDDWRVAGNLAMVGVLRDDALPDMSRLLSFAQLAAPWHHFGVCVLGAAQFRAGKFEEAVQSFETAAESFRPRAWDWSFLAMAHHRLGHADEARRCLGEARRWIADANRQTEDDVSDTQPTWGGWDESIVYPLLLHEAETVLGFDDSTPATR